MRKILLFVFLFLIACGGTEVENTISQDSFDSSDEDEDDSEDEWEDCDEDYSDVEQSLIHI